MINKKTDNFFEKKFFYSFFARKMIYEVKRQVKINKFINTHKLQNLSDLIIKGYKSSDTIFILGSGDSINHLTEEQWAMINSNDSLGINFWLIHDFIPTYYMFESTKNIERINVLLKLFALKKTQYQHTPLILKNIEYGFPDFHKFPPSLLPNLYVPYKLNIPGSNSFTFQKSLQSILFLRLNQITNLLLMKTASLSMAISFAFSVGYKKIVFCGVDLNNTKYFYEDDKYHQRQIPIPPKVQNNTVHNTLSSNYADVTIDEVIFIMNKYLLIPNGIELYIGSKKSALYPMLPYYFDFNN